MNLGNHLTYRFLAPANKDKCRGLFHVCDTLIATPPRSARLLLLFLATFCWGAPANRSMATPPYTIKQTPSLRYIEKETWFDSMLASRAALRNDEAAGERLQPKVSFHSDSCVVASRCEASVGVAGVEEIYLYVTGAPDVEYGAADWIAPRAIDAKGNETLLCSEKFIDLQRGFHTVDCSLRSRVDPPLRVADREYAHGINIQAPGKIRIKLPTGTVRFEAQIGIDDWVNPDSYRLSQPYYYQPHHFSEPALRRHATKTDATVERGRSFSRHGCGWSGTARSVDASGC